MAGQMNWADVLARVAHDDQNKADFRVRAAELRMVGGHFQALEGKQFAGETFVRTVTAVEQLGLTDHAFGQVTSRCGMPTKYVRGLPTNLSDQLFNHHLHELSLDREPQFLLRAKGTLCRAFLSATYTIINNATILNIVSRVTEGRFNHVIHRFDLDENGVWLKLLIPELFVEDPSAPGKQLFVGVIIGNSEIGDRMATIEPFICRKACTNDLVIVVDDALYQRHAFVDEEELEIRVTRAISQAFRSGHAYLQSLIDARNERIERPEDVIAEMCERRDLSQEMTRNVQLAYQGEPDASMFGVVNAFTAAAQTLSGNARVDLERFAGQILSGRFRGRRGKEK